jgi:hypothetical protein
MTGLPILVCFYTENGVRDTVGRRMNADWPSFSGLKAIVASLLVRTIGGSDAFSIEIVPMLKFN